jgi:hypothetical protein
MTHALILPVDFEPFSNFDDIEIKFIVFLYGHKHLHFKGWDSSFSGEVGVITNIRQ